MGAGNPIGRACAERLAAEGARVEPLDEANCDIADPDGMREAADRCGASTCSSTALLGRLPRLHEVAAAAVYAASDAAGAMTGAVLNLSCGAVFG